MEFLGFFVFSCVEALLARYIIKKHAKLRIIDEIRKFHRSNLSRRYTLSVHYHIFFTENDIFMIFYLPLSPEMMPAANIRQLVLV